MLKVLAPQPGPHAIATTHVRGRSRQVSHVALTRQASEERSTSRRRRFMLCAYDTIDEKQVPLDTHSLPLTTSAPACIKPVASRPTNPAVLRVTQPMFFASPSSSSSTTPSTSTSSSSHYYDSPPSPPRSLEDQVHVAYAQEDIHLAKILLLKLKGIEVTSDDDPRIAEVQDEDFDLCFVPPGGLLDAESEKTVLERQRRELQILEEKRREERLQQCGRIWEREKRRLRAERENELRRRRKKDEHEQRRRSQCDDVVDGFTHLRMPPQRSVVSFDHLTTLTSRSAPELTSSPFLYSFMPTTPSSPPRPRSQRQPYRPVLSVPFDDSQSIPFKDVLTSMDGPLFPPSQECINPRRTRQQVQLLDALLEAVNWERGERRRVKGKAKAEFGCAHDTGSPSSICSVCTATPSSSAFSPSSAPGGAASKPPDDGPLFISHTAARKPLVHTPPPLQRATSTSSVIVKQMSRFVKLAKGFQNAYMNAALFSVVASIDSYEDRYVGVGVSRGGVGGGIYHPPPSAIGDGRKQEAPVPRRKLRPAGYRVRSMDVALLVGTTSSSTAASTSVGAADTSIDIPLRVRYHPSSSEPSKPRTVLPNPLPYPIVFKPHQPVSRSPFRHLTDAYLMGDDSSYPPPSTSCHSRSRSCPYEYGSPVETISCRVRIIANPVHLRLKALQNVVWHRGVAWEGREKPDCSETSLGSGREKLLALAFDGVGRSSLSRDARVRRTIG
ncbi:hypothetical protein BDN72DRAFT_877789 [Pluteus cervinus]|uniref:Uncharacterized protein n=1 Tax=Pluteus cervinus TaxID=181527 RepID=A0ACD3AXC8_9AGAR|nr:hypothetical protein BDN72DRAFT_877789 [Pluteus cervinus]